MYAYGHTWDPARWEREIRRSNRLYRLSAPAMRGRHLMDIDFSGRCFIALCVILLQSHPTKSRLVFLHPGFISLPP